MTLRVRLLGTAQLSHNDQPILIRGHKPLALLAYLLVTGKPHSRQHLVDLLFDGPSDPKASLRWTLSELRKGIGPDYILADRQHIAFNFESDYWLDVTDFEAGQLNLYRDDFLEGLHLRDAFSFEDWVLFERERLRGRYQTALEQQLAEAESRDDDLAMIETAHRLLKLDNLREDWYRLLMRAYAKQGKRDAALAQFEQCRRVLQAELDVEPIAETATLAEAIQLGRFEPLRPDPEHRTHRIAGRFIIEDLDQNLLGQGTMGQVYRGKDTQTGQPVAIKIIKPDIIVGQPHLVQRFVREGEVLRRLNHPNIVKMVAAAEEEGRYYLIMEYIEGGSLRDLLEAQGHLSLERTLDLALDLADALTRAHRLDIIHRDLKPANILLTPDGAPRLADFGIARSGNLPRLTQTGLVMGTVDYLSPEACEGKPLDARADIWAFGVLLYEMLTGKRPFPGETLVATLTAILTQPTPNLTEQRPDIPEALANLIDRMLEKDPQQRVPSVRLVGAELEAILTGREAGEQRIPSTSLKTSKGTEERGSGEDLTPTPPHLHPSAQQRPRFPTLLVGREPEMERLRQIWQQATETTGQIVLVEGEPGIGKTRLIEELLAEVAGQALILRAKCPELQQPLAYTLFVDPLRDALAGERPSALSDVWLAEISRLLPDLPNRYPDLPQPPPLDPAAERRRLFDAISATLLSLTSRQPLALFIDDLQWADLTSFEVLNHLSSKMSQAPLLVLGTYRSNEVGPDHPLQRPRRDWQRAGLLTEFALAPLSNKAVLDLLRELTTWSGDDPSFGELVYRETAGNPLFVVETIASLRDEGRLPQDAADWQRDFRTESVTIPTQVQTLIGARLNRLDDLSHQIVTTAAVMRSSFRADTVQTVSGRNELETLEGLECLLASGLLVEQGAEQFTFSHDKIREVAYGSLSQLRRKLLHRRVAETLEQQHRGRETVIAGRLAYHFEQAGNQEKALAYHLEAGHAAKAQYAPEAAIEHYQKAVALLKAQEDFERAAQISMQLGLVQHQVFDFQGSQQAYEEAFALQQQVDKPQPTPTRSLPPEPLTLKVAWEKEVATLDPNKVADIFSSGIVDQLFSGLAEPRPQMEVVPDVARSWEVLEGGQKYIFHLRDDVYWSDEAHVTAMDFEYAWKRVLDPSIESNLASLLYGIKGAKAFHQGEVRVPDWVGVQALDDATLVVELEQPIGYFLQLLSHNVTYPVPRHIVERYGENWTMMENIVTNGPFRLRSWNLGKFVVLSRNPTYHGRFTGNVERIELTAGESPTVKLEMYEADDLDTMSFGFKSLELNHVRRRHSGEYISVRQLQTAYLGLNASRPPFNDRRVRRAFALATDREPLPSVIKGSLLPATGGFIPPDMPGHSTGIALPYNPDQARHLLAQAGYPEGRRFPVVEWLIFQGLEAAGDYLQRQWRENLGIEIRWEAPGWAEFSARQDRKPAHMYMASWSADYADPDNFLRVCLGWHWIRWQNETFNRLVKEARREMDQGTRMKMYEQADRILVEEAAVLPLFHSKRSWLVKPWVSNFPMSPRNLWFPKDVIIEPREAQLSTSLPASHILRIGGGVQPPILDWAKFADDNVSILIDQLFGGLAKMNPEMDLVPDVAQSWEILEGGQKYIFHLRDDVRWSDGTPVTAGDFEYAWKRMLDPATCVDNVTLLYDIKGARAFHQGKISDPNQIGAYALDKVTLAVELEEPNSYFLHLLTTGVTYPVPRHIVEAYPENWTHVDKIVTNGPFELKVWDPNGRVVLARNSLYHGQFNGNTTQIEFITRADPAAILDMYAANKLDIVNFPVPQLGKALQRYADDYTSGSAQCVFFVDFDVNRPPFSNPRVRRAFALATDKTQLVNEITQGTAAPATGGFVPVGMPGHSAEIGLPYDPGRARHLLAEAGYPGGRDFPAVDLLIWPRQVPTGEYLTTQWQKNLGVEVRLEVVEWTEIFDRWAKQPASLHFNSWIADYPDPDSFLRVAFEAHIRWRDETYDRLVTEAGQVTEQSKRLKLYRQADKILIDGAAILPLTYPHWNLLVKPWVKMLPASTAKWWQFEGVAIEPH